MREARDLRLGCDATLAEIVQAHVKAVVANQGGNRARAATVLGIGERTIYRYLGGAKKRAREHAAVRERRGILNPRGGAWASKVDAR